MLRKLSFIGVFLVIVAVGFVLVTRQADAEKNKSTASSRSAATGSQISIIAPLATPASTKSTGDDQTIDPEATNGVEDDADIPPFMWGKIDKEEYLEKRDAHLRQLRGIEAGKKFDPTARGR